MTQCNPAGEVPTKQCAAQWGAGHLQLEQTLFPFPFWGGSFVTLAGTLQAAFSELSLICCHDEVLFL